MSLGIGTGWMPEEHELLGLEVPALGERFDRLEEALAYARAALGPGDDGFTGSHYRLADRPVNPRPTGRLPIIVGGQGPTRTPRLAGTYADEFNVFDKDGDIAPKIAAARRAAAAAGRDPKNLLISVLGGAVTGADEAGYRRNLTRMAELDPFGRSPAQIEADYRRRRLPVGPAPEAREAVAALAETGVDRCYVQHLGPIDEGLIEETFDLIRG